MNKSNSNADSTNSNLDAERSQLPTKTSKGTEQLFSINDLSFKMVRDIRVVLAVSIAFYLLIPLLYYYWYLGWTLLDSYYVSKVTHYRALIVF